MEEINEKIKNKHKLSHNISGRDHVRILSINGGGVKGIVPALILKEIEKEAGRPIQEIFDYVVGTSVGGIIATALSVPNQGTGEYAYNASTIPGFFNEAVERVFPQYTFNFWKSIVGGVWSAPYSRDGIDGFLNEKLGELRFNDTLLPISVFSYCENTQGPRFWTSFDSNNFYYLKDAAGATSAAPTYLPAKESINITCYRECDDLNPATHWLSKVGLDDSCNKMCTTYDIDGGIYINNPVMMGYSILASVNPHITRHDVTVVSLGTGKVKTSYDNPSLYTSKLSTLTSDVMIHEKMMEGSQLAADISAQLHFGDQYIVFNPFIEEKNKNLDDSSKQNMKELSETTTEYLNKPEIKETIKALVTCLKAQGEDSDSCMKVSTILNDADDINYSFSPQELNNFLVTRDFEHKAHELDDTVNNFSREMYIGGEIFSESGEL
ncbi:MAG: patatin-like phospholipase family protein [Rickettsiales bacterium]